MLPGYALRTLLQGLTLSLLGPVCQAASLGLTVAVVPLESDGGQTVQAHFSAIVPLPCPSLNGLCARGEDCEVYNTSLPFNGTRPGPGWCIRQWRKKVPSNYRGTISLGSNTFYVSLKAAPTVREDTGTLNRPAFAALPPPLRAGVNCPRDFPLSVRDLDGDKVQCRFARAELGECVDCAGHPFIQLEKEKCTLTFTGKAPAGQYFIYLMVEDRNHAPAGRPVSTSSPLSAVPLHLSVTVEGSGVGCGQEPAVAQDTPAGDTRLTVLPYLQVKFNVNFMSRVESVLEIAVVGPPNLFRVGFRTVGPLATMTLAWVRAQNNLAQLLPICFAVNTQSMQSEPRCVWLYQREMAALPPGTELTCGKTKMVLLLPITSFQNVNLTELQLNSPTCPISHNNTHLTASISLDGCGTQTVHTGSELVYVNTLQSVQSSSVVVRKPSLILPLACRIPGVQAKGPVYRLNIPTETEVFGPVAFSIQLYLPGEGPFGNFTRAPRLLDTRTRVRRDAEPPLQSANGSMEAGSRIQMLYLTVMSNCSIGRAEMVVSNCIESETEDFANYNTIIHQGCLSSSAAAEVVIAHPACKVYQLDLSQRTTASMMYVRCRVNLCITTLPSTKCPDLCSDSFTPRALVGNLYTETYTVSSAPISLLASTSATSPVPTAATTRASTSAQPATANGKVLCIFFFLP
uniref:ZP domain-containing protein n=1 Tax=Tetraodon nigroviridis TaxID=99883 RepID=H3C3J3_TETNG